MQVIIVCACVCIICACLLKEEGKEVKREKNTQKYQYLSLDGLLCDLYILCF